MKEAGNKLICLSCSKEIDYNILDTPFADTDSCIVVVCDNCGECIVVRKLQYKAKE
jgi:hypothetical protein